MMKVILVVSIGGCFFAQSIFANDKKDMEQQFKVYVGIDAENKKEVIISDPNCRFSEERMSVDCKIVSKEKKEKRNSKDFSLTEIVNEKLTQGTMPLDKCKTVEDDEAAKALNRRIMHGSGRKCNFRDKTTDSEIEKFVEAVVNCASLQKGVLAGPCDHALNSFVQKGMSPMNTPMFVSDSSSYCYVALKNAGEKNICEDLEIKQVAPPHRGLEVTFRKLNPRMEKLAEEIRNCVEDACNQYIGNIVKSDLTGYGDVHVGSWHPTCMEQIRKNKEMPNCKGLKITENGRDGLNLDLAE